MIENRETGTTSNVTVIEVSWVLIPSAFDDLMALVRRYVGPQRMDYRAFRRELIEGFFPRSDRDRTVERLYNAIESGCATYEEGFISASGLHCYFNGLVALHPAAGAVRDRGDHP